MDYETLERDAKRTMEQLFYKRLARKLEATNGTLGVGDKFLVRKAVQSYMNHISKNIGPFLILESSNDFLCYESRLCQLGFNAPSEE